MSMPGFTAEASLEKSRTSYHMVAVGTATPFQVVPQLRCSALCGRISTKCTFRCNPSDYACRTFCDNLFFGCLEYNCGVIATPPEDVIL